MQRFNSEKEIAILWRNYSISNNESKATRVNFHTEKHTDFKGCRQQIKEIGREQDNNTTKDQHFLAPYPFTHQHLLFCVPNPYLTVIYDRFSGDPDTKVRLS